MSEGVKLATDAEAEARKVYDAALAVGVAPEVAELIATAYHREHGDKAEAPEICGNVSKDGNKYLCTRQPHPDEPGNRTPHAFKLETGEVVTWTGALTFGEQLEAETASGDPRCGYTCEDHGWHTCVRSEHGDDMPHLAWMDYVPDPIFGPCEGDPERVLVSWHCET